jgi:uncharacterized protein YjbI with pentapeptide repeats
MPQDFSGKNLRGRNFKGENLTGAKFIGADIRGANFTNAILREADFTRAKAGLQRRWTIFLVTISLFLSLISGFMSARATLWIAVFFTPDIIKQYTIRPGVVVLIVLAIFFIATIRQGLGAATEAGAAAVAVAVAGAVGVAVAAAGAGAVAVAAIAAVAVAGTVAAAAAAALAVAGTGAVAGVGAATAAVAVAAAVAVGVAGAATAAVAVAGLGIYVAWRALAGDEKHALIRSIAIAFATTGGTSFRNADLTDANFTKATLKSTDFRTANLTRTCFHNTEKLDRARVGNSILADTRVRELLVTSNGYKKSYVGANLQGANLTGANLNYANLKQANLSEATLHQANLEWANLTETQALATDFTAAYFTGACLEAWNIGGNTKLDRADCRFVYLLEYPKPGTDDRERRPSSGEFAPGEFTKLFDEVLNTIDLIFRNGIDWKAFVAAFKKVQVENEGTELTIQSIENKGDGVIVVKVSVPPDANKEHIHQNFTQSYELMAARLEDKDKQITFLEGVVNQLAAKPVTIEVKATAENKIASDNIDQSRQLDISGGTVNATGAGSLSLGDNDGTTANSIEELPDPADHPS